MKICNKCNQNKDINEFTKRPDSIDGYRGACKQCRNKQNLCYIKNSNTSNRKPCTQCGKERQNEFSRVHKDLCQTCYRSNSVQDIRKRTDRVCGECGCNSSSKWYQGPICRSCYRKKESTRIKENNKHKYISKRIANNLRSRVSKIVSGTIKNGSAVNDLGCSIEDLKTHLESKFKDGMTWENYGQWHIDHVRPLSSFNLAVKQEFKSACHYSNLQPLWAKDNLIKSNKYEDK
jgi:hypothetical protein